MLQINTRIPITIYPTFWIFAALIGYINSQSFLGTLIWVGIILVSVLFHELGHALTSRAFGLSPRIELVALGGLTYHNGQKLPFWKQFFIVLNGPIFGFMLALLAGFLLQFPAFAQGTIASILSLTRIVNLFWTVVNLLPVMPLDGGQLLRLVLEKFCGLRGFKYSLIASTVIALGFSVFFFLTQGFLIGALFFLLAFQSYDTIRKTRHLTESDRDDSLRQLLEQIEEKMQTGKKDEAYNLCQEARTKSKKGMIFELATQYLSFLEYEKGNKKAAYDLLCSIRSEIAGDALCFLHKVAFEQKDFTLVAELGGPCFQHLPTADIALRNAFAHAQLSQAPAAVGWLQTALSEGLSNAPQVLADPAFDAIRSDSSFKELQARVS